MSDDLVVIGCLDYSVHVLFLAHDSVDRDLVALFLVDVAVAAAKTLAQDSRSESSKDLRSPCCLGDYSFSFFSWIFFRRQWLHTTVFAKFVSADLASSCWFSLGCCVIQKLSTRLTTNSSSSRGRLLVLCVGFPPPFRISQACFFWGSLFLFSAKNNSFGSISQTERTLHLACKLVTSSG